MNHRTFQKIWRRRFKELLVFFSSGCDPTQGCGRIWTDVFKENLNTPLKDNQYGWNVGLILILRGRNKLQYNGTRLYKRLSQKQLKANLINNCHHLLFLLEIQNKWYQHSFILLRQHYNIYIMIQIYVALVAYIMSCLYQKAFFMLRIFQEVYSNCWYVNQMVILI